MSSTRTEQHCAVCAEWIAPGSLHICREEREADFQANEFDAERPAGMGIPATVGWEIATQLGRVADALAEIGKIMNEEKE